LKIVLFAGSCRVVHTTWDYWKRSQLTIADSGISTKARVFAK
jgi:hypothetical protein